MGRWPARPVFRRSVRAGAFARAMGRADALNLAAVRMAAVHLLRNSIRGATQSVFPPERFQLFVEP